VASRSDDSARDTPEVGRPSPPAGQRHTAVSVLRTNTLTWFMKSRFELRDWRLRVVSPRAILGVIPFGRTDVTYPLEDLSDIRVTGRVHPVRLAIALALAALAALVDLGRIATVAVQLVAVAFFFLSVIVVVRIEDRTGRRRFVPVCFLQRASARGLVAQVERARARLGAG
jgi:hypothetical protein